MNLNNCSFLKDMVTSNSQFRTVLLMTITFVQKNFVLKHTDLIKFFSNVSNLHVYLHSEYLTYLSPENACYSKTGSGGKKVNYSTS